MNNATLEPPVFDDCLTAKQSTVSPQSLVTIVALALSSYFGEGQLCSLLILSFTDLLLEVKPFSKLQYEKKRMFEPAVLLLTFREDCFHD